MGLLRRLRGLIAELVGESVADRVTGLAAEVAFFATLSIFPGLLLIAAGIGWLDALAGNDLARRSQEIVLRFLSGILTERGSGAVEAVRELFTRRSGGVLTVAGLAALWSLSRGFAAVIRALNIAYDVEERRPWLKLRLMALALAVGSVVTTAVALGMIVVGPLFGRGRDLAEALGLGDAFAFAWAWVRVPVAAVLVVGWATTLLHLSPSRRTPWRRDLPGAILAAALWLALSFGFGLYLRVAAGGNEVFGALGGGLILLTWLYLIAFSLLLGGELNAILERRAGTLDVTPSTAARDPAPRPRFEVMAKEEPPTRSLGR